MKKLTVRQFATVKRVAQNVNPLVVKRNKIVAKIRELQEEQECLEAEISGHEAGIIAMTGYMSEALVTKVVETTDKRDKDGNPVKVTKYLPTELVEFNKEENCYYIYEVQVPAPDHNSFGSDFDIDAERINSTETL